jgi:hypothetical protein
MKFSMSTAWNDAMALLRANRQVVLGIAGVFFFLPYLAIFLLMPEYAAAMGAAGTEQAKTVAEALEEATRIYGEIWWAVLLMGILQGIGMLGLLTLLTDRQRPTVGEALAKGAKYLLPYLGTQILIAIAAVAIVMIPVALGTAAGVGAGLLAGLVAAPVLIYLLTKLSLSTPVIAIEGQMNPFAVLARSWRLTRGNSLRLFLFYLLLFIVLIVVSMVLGMVIAALTLLAGDEGGLIVSGLFNAVLNLVTVVIVLAVLAAVHRQLAGPSAAAVSETFE